MSKTSSFETSTSSHSTMGRRDPAGRGPQNFMPGDKAKDFRGSMKKLLAYLGRFVPAIIACFLVAIGATVFNIFGPRILANATNEIVTGLMAMISNTGSIDLEAVRNFLLWALLIYLVSATLMLVQGFLLAGISNKIGYRLRRDISAKIDNLPLSYFDRNSYGDVLSRITNDVDTLTQTLTQSMPQLISGITTILGVLIMMLTINVWMTLLTLLILPLSMVLVRAVVKRSQPYFAQQQQYLGEANGQVEEMYGGHMVVKAFGREEESLKTFSKVNQKLYASAWKSQFLSGMMMPLMVMVGNIGYVLMCVAGGFLALSGAITVGDIQAFIQYMRNFTQPLSQIANSSNVLQQTAAAAERVFAFLEEKEEIKDVESVVDTQKLSASVQFHHVNFGYVPEKTIVHNFSANVNPGQKVAIVGPTGAGKTTMVKLLMRFYDVNEGTISVGNQDIKELKRHDLRTMFGMVLQETWLYGDSIMENIRYGRRNASDDEVIEAAKTAQAHRFIRTLPKGYNMMLNEDASNISQGQKQLLTIARTILADPKILILDEATSSVDTRTEVAIQKAMDSLMKDRTSFVIAHRLSTIRNADMILVMRDGDIVETGNHKDLLAKKGFYADLYNSQFEPQEEGA